MRQLSLMEMVGFNRYFYEITLARADTTDQSFGKRLRPRNGLSNWPILVIGESLNRRRVSRPRPNVSAPTMSGVWPNCLQDFRCRSNAVERPTQGVAYAPA